MLTTGRNRLAFQVLLLLVATSIPIVQALGKCEGLPKYCAEVKSTQECSELWQCINIGGGVCGSLNLSGISARSCEWFDGDKDLCEMHGCSYYKQVGHVVRTGVVILIAVVAAAASVVICRRQCRRRNHQFIVESVAYQRAPACNSDLMRKAEPDEDVEALAAPPVAPSAKIHVATTI